ncbi:MAG: polyprenyl synthetase family protein [Planctomycetota bacterium]|nr:polyprenyl synthetase family protein [Planctomycetota bacterium]
MKLPMVNLPPPVPLQVERTPQKNIPQSREEREAVKRYIHAHLSEHTLVPPVPLEELRGHAVQIIEKHNLNPIYEDYVGVLLNNEVWSEQLATVPYNKRLLLLPKCMRVEEKCPAPFDEFGLLCKECGLCSIQDLQVEAERLGYACLVAEGSALVMAMIQTGQIHAIVGVSCLSVLEKAFPYTEAAAIPCIAIPLLQDDCKDTNVDIEWVWDVIHLTSDDKTRRMDLDGLRKDVDKWFAKDALHSLLGTSDEDPTTKLGVEWLARAGKRWRPFLAVCSYKALQADLEAPLPADMQKIAVAVECFHKASLIHDDIEDDDELRYGEKTMHAEEGVAMALNVGDYLLGEGYRLLAECDCSPKTIAEMMKVAAQGHRTLCLGQGQELAWAQNPQVLKSRQVLEIFRKKTAPAFEVALKVGAARAGADETVFEVLSKYSDALGIAYQIHDDLDDLNDAEAPNDIAALRPTLPLAIAYERAWTDEKELLGKAWQRADEVKGQSEKIKEVVLSLKVEERLEQLREAYKEEAIRSLVDLELDHSSLKGLLRRVIGKIFTLEIKGWCSEFETRNAASSPPLPEIAR